jgi:pyrroline-5-carboxylate reductase
MTYSESTDLGFIGAGELTAALVAGLRAPGIDAPAIHVSPRGEEISERLAAQYQRVSRAPSNQAVIDRSGIVVLAMRPQQLDDALRGLRFRSDQTVVSLVAGVRTNEIAAMVRPATAVCRAIPLASVARREGPIVLYPHVAAIADLLAPLGDLVIARSEEEVMAYGCASGLISSYFALQNTAIGWLADRGVERAEASRYVRSMLASLAAAAQRTDDARLADLPGRFETRGGLNERTRRRLTRAGWLDAVTDALDALMSGTDLRGKSDRGEPPRSAG